jgi:DNA-binding CsgD family transcriptional regulator
MPHLRILIGFFILITGGAAIAQIISLQRRHPLPFLGAFIRFLVIFNLYFFLQTALDYYFTNIQPNTDPQRFFWINSLTDLVFSILLLFITWLVMKLAHQLAKNPVSRWMSTGFLAISLLTAVIHIYLLLQSAPQLNTRPLFRMMLVYVVIFHLGVMFAFLWNSLRNKNTLPPVQQSLYSRITRVVLFMKGLSLVCMPLFYASWLPINLSFYAVFFLYNLLPILTIGGISKTLYADQLSQPQALSDTELETRCAAYGISKREQEIITLVLEGCSNRDIEDRLFISLATVKDHIYKIYKKTGVKNRVQLVNLLGGHPR